MKNLKIKITESQLKKIVNLLDDEEQIKEGFLSDLYDLVPDNVKELISSFKNGDINKTEFKKELESDKEKYDGNIIDISSSSNYKNKNKKLTSNKYFILHHSAGGKTAQDVMNVLNNRGLGVQWIIDKKGKIYQTLPKGSKGAHVLTNKELGLSNSNTQGVEIVANDDSDVTITQCVSALKLVKMLGYSQNQIYGHGEVQSNKQRTEGQKCKKYFKSNW